MRTAASTEGYARTFDAYVILVGRVPTAVRWISSQQAEEAATTAPRKESPRGVPRLFRIPEAQVSTYLFLAEFTDNRGLDYWSPYSRTIRAESHDNPDGPHTFANEVVGPFSHNPTVVYNAAEELYLMYYIGCPQVVDSVCTGPQFTCGPGNYINGESGISVQSSPDLINWTPHGQIFAGADSPDWDADVTNPSPLPLYTDADQTFGHALCYRGRPLNPQRRRTDKLRRLPTGFRGPYTKIQADPIFTNNNEDPFVWRDKRGHYHMLLHSLEAGAASETVQKSAGTHLRETMRGHGRSIYKTSRVHHQSRI